MGLWHPDFAARIQEQTLDVRACEITGARTSTSVSGWRVAAAMVVEVKGMLAIALQRFDKVVHEGGKQK